MVYEAVLLFGVLMIAGLLYSVITQQRHALQGRPGMQAFIFAVLGLYFVWFWTHGGQTLAMKTWRVRLVAHDGAPVGWLRAVLRYGVCWVWLAPALAVAAGAGWRGAGTIGAVSAIWVLLYGGLSRLHPQRQFWHDALCGTRLVDAPRSAAVSPERDNASP
jgi:uncharacterized RDD family membrane protein YckC